MFIDLEFTMPPYNYQHNNATELFYSEIIEYGIYIEDSLGNGIDSAKGFIRPKCELGINERTCEFVHVSKEKLKNAPYYSNFYDTLNDFIMCYQPTIYIWGKNDYLMIDKSYKLYNVKPITERKNFINLMQIMKNYFNLKDDIGLYNAFDLLGSPTPMATQDHDAYHDTLATVELFHLFLKEILN
jgi:sporulation inhibitor KapD